ncbi:MULTISPECIES: ClpXP protease specificity-enhancing factor [Pandoraea]|uniref:Stringent starvation protein B n=1 Tax=Pandoraea communis TaxID=2508297 RepID=A0A5E4XYT8_9BURK|nr:MULTISPECIES: ClpXP protease specificity-enhancing factor [Pandoraea]EON11354.1 ClpXP protease specificity-enhancing factor [Pandoraea sp. SD6-2]VVE41272.1 stringent starvation protein B [Pandoraea communis]
MPETSTKPYLLRALYEWCTDNGYTPYLAVHVDAKTRVPREFVKDGEIVLNISFDATSGLQMGNDWIEFSARFGGISQKVEVQVPNVLAIYARENGQGMAFPVDKQASADEGTELEAVPSVQAPGDDDPEPPRPDGNAPAGGNAGRARLKVVK